MSEKWCKVPTIIPRAQDDVIKMLVFLAKAFSLQSDTPEKNKKAENHHIYMVNGLDFYSAFLLLSTTPPKFTNSYTLTHPNGTFKKP